MLQTGLPKGLPTGTVTFLFTDIEGSSQLWEHHPDVMVDALTRHDELIQYAIEDHDGYIMKSKGDGFCAAFSKASDAVKAALVAQFALQSEKWSAPIEQISSRMGLHSGTADIRNGDYFGPALNRVARIEAAGHGGQILLSRATQSLIRDDLPEEVELVDLGKYRLRNLVQPERIFQVASSDLAADFPPLRTIEEKSSILPTQQTSFIGREQELNQIIGLIDNPKCRLLTLVGPGGIGKTRLAIKAADLRLNSYPDGIHFIPLAPLTSPESLVPAIAQVLQFSFDTHSSNLDPSDQLLDYLRSQNNLLVLDNFEHLLEGVGWLTDLLEQAPAVKLLVTSREKLNLQGEWTYEVKHMRYPQNGNGSGIEEYSAIQLFLERARQINLDFSLSEDDRHHVNHICRLVDGTPLGIELAAAWVSMLSCQEIAEEIGRNIDFLTSSMHGVPDRQRSLRAVFDSSWKMLSAEQKDGYQTLMVFQGGFDRDAAREVAGVNLFLLAQLVNKSLLWRTPDGRYQRHEILGQFATEKLHASPEKEAEVRDRHARYFLGYLSERTPYLVGPDLFEFREQVRAEMENVNKAVTWALKRWPKDRALEVLDELHRFYMVNGWHQGQKYFSAIAQDLQSRYGAALEPENDYEAALIKALIFQASYDSSLGRHEESEKICQQCLPALTDIEAGFSAEICFQNMGINAVYRGENDEARLHLEKAIDIARKIEDQMGLGISLLWLGWVYYSLGDFTEAEIHFQECYRLNKQSGNEWSLAFALSKLSLVADALGRYEEANRFNREGREIFIRFGDKAGEAYCVSRLSMTAFHQADFETAKEYAAGSFEMFESIGHRWGMAASLCRYGFGALGLNETSDAKIKLMEALERSVTLRLVTTALYALAGLSCALGIEGQYELSAEIFFFVFKNPSTLAVYKEMVEPYFTNVKESLSPGELAAAEERASSKELEDIYALLLQNPEKAESQ